MKPLVLLPVGLVTLCVGVACGIVLGGAPDEAVAPADTEVLVRGERGEVRTLTAEAAAARIENLESLLRQSRDRRAAQTSSETEEQAAPERNDPEALLPQPPLLHPDGRRYTDDELRALARGSKDPELRAAAIRALRRMDTEDARTTLQAILDDPETPRDMQLLAAQMLVSWPHRDHLPGELIEALRTETDPELRRIYAQGVGSLRERGAWMREISELLGDETDDEVRRALFGAVARTARDPAARQELLDIASDPLASAAERTMALGALTRGRPDKETVAALQPLLDDPDPEVRAKALRILGSDRGMPLSTLQAGLTDTDPSVRATALWHAMDNFGTIAKDKDVDKGRLAAAANQAVQLATSDPDAAVRRAGVWAARNLPKDLRDQVLAAGRDDPDLAVRVTAYANSPRDVAIQATDQFVGALSSSDRSLRDYAYNQLRRLHGIRVPYQGDWNPDARAAAILEIQQAIGN